MQRTTLSLPEELLERLRLMAAERHTSIAQVMREALEEKAKSFRPKPKSIGIGDSGYTDTARLASEGPIPPRPWR